MNILITGGAGFIGTKLIEKLSPKHKILVIDNFINQVHGTSPKIITGVEYIIGNICNKEVLNKCVNFNPEIIFHLAAETGTAQSMYEISRYINTNVSGTAVLLENLSNFKKITKLILSSTRAVYGTDPNTLETNDILQPISIYGLSKLFQEKLIKSFSKVPYVIFRYQNVYGPGQSLNNPHTGIVSIFFKKIKNNEDIEIYDNGSLTRDFIYVDDAVNATLLGMNEDIKNKIYNVGTGIETKLLDIAKIIKKELNSTSNIKIVSKHRDGDILQAKGCIDIIKAELGWSPKIDIKTGIKKLIDLS